MTNNYILRRLRYTFNYNDDQVVALFGKGELTVTRQQISAWLKKDDDPDYVRLTDQQFAHFLNGLILENRGPQDGKKAKVEYALNNNIILRKLKIAFSWIDQDILDLLASADFRLGKAELSAFFRKPDHRHYRECQDQVLRNILQGLQLKHTASSTAKKQSNYQALKGTAQNRKDAQKKSGQKKGHQKPFTEKKKEKVKYVNPKKQAEQDESKQPELSEKKKRSTIKLKKEKPESNKAKKDSTTDSKEGFSWKPIPKPKQE